MAVAKTSSSKRSSKKSPPAPEPEPVRAEPVAEVKTEAEPATTQEQTEEPTLESVLSDYNEVALALKALNLTLKRLVVSQAKRIKELEKAAAKGSGKKRRVANPDAKKNNGFNKPTRVSADMCTFLGIPADQMVSRSEVSKAVHGYIKEHNLQKEENRRHINPDAKLRALLGSAPDQEVTYFNLQRFLAPHYIKEE